MKNTLKFRAEVEIYQEENYIKSNVWSQLGMQLKKNQKPRE